MDRTPLHAFVDELAASERFRAFAASFPSDARVSEPALPLVLATLYATLERPLVCLFPEDEQARDAADAIAWYLGDGAVGLLPSRGVHPGSGLEPPPHLVGERDRGLGRRAARRRPTRVASHVLRRRALVGGARRGPRTRRLPARRAGRRARPDLGPRRDRRRLPEHRAGAAAGRVLRRRDRAAASVLAVHPADPARGRGGGRPSRRRTAAGA